MHVDVIKTHYFHTVAKKNCRPDLKAFDFEHYQMEACVCVCVFQVFKLIC